MGLDSEVAKMWNSSLDRRCVQKSSSRRLHLPGW